MIGDIFWEKQMEQKTILVADDDPGILGLFNQMLTPEGYRVLTASNGKEAVEATQDDSVDVALVDVKMPVMDGLEALREIKGIDQTVQVLIITGNADIEDLREAIIDLGAFDYIVKPVSKTELVHNIKNALLKREFLLQKDLPTPDLEEWLTHMEKNWEERTRHLRESQIKYKQIIENSNDSIVAVQDGKIKFANPRTLELTGYSQDEILGIPAIDLVHPDDRAMVTKSHMRILRGETSHATYTFRALGKQGTVFWVEDSAIRTIWEERPATQEFIRDVSERKWAEEALKKAYAELKETQEKLIQSEKLAALGRFSSGVAHEIKNPLGIILGGIGFLENRLGSVDQDIKTVMDKIRESTMRADSIIQGLLKFARPSKLETERIRSQDIMRETLSLLEYRAPLRGIRIFTQFAKDDLYIKVDKNQIQQVLFNLLMNAVEAMPDGGQIEINIDKAMIPEFSSHLPLCLIQIVDTGEGISKEDLQRIFEPFFTTKRDRTGTGLGLSISKMIVDKHKGDLIIGSQPGEGTDVKLLIPLD